MCIDFNTTLKNLGMTQTIPDLASHWDSSRACKPGNLPFIQADYLSQWEDVLILPNEARQALEQTYAKIRENQDLENLAWHCHYLFFIANQHISQWPDLHASLG